MIAGTGMNLRYRTAEHATCADLAAEVKLFAELTREAPPEKLEPSNTPKWGAREILIHLVFWHGQYVSIIKSLWENKEPVLLRGTFKSINARCIHEYVMCTTEELVVKLEKSQRELAFLAQLVNGRDLRFSFKKGSKLWPFPDFVDAITGHFRKHRLQVEEMIAD